MFIFFFFLFCLLSCPRLLLCSRSYPATVARHPQASSDGNSGNWLRLPPSVLRQISKGIVKFLGEFVDFFYAVCPILREPGSHASRNSKRINHYRHHPQYDVDKVPDAGGLGLGHGQALVLWSTSLTREKEGGRRRNKLQKAANSYHFVSVWKELSLFPPDSLAELKSRCGSRIDKAEKVEGSSLWH